MARRTRPSASRPTRPPDRVHQYSAQPSGADGQPSPYACPMGYDPREYCDKQTRMNAMGDARYLWCRASFCKWVGRNIPADERYPQPGGAA